MTVFYMPSQDNRGDKTGRWGLPEGGRLNGYKDEEKAKEAYCQEIKDVSSVSGKTSETSGFHLWSFTEDL